MKKQYKIILLFSLLALAQIVYSFLAPNYGTNECWKSLGTLSSYKGHSFDSFDKKLVGKLASLAADYHSVCDGAGFVLLAHDFPQDYFRGRNLFINRPVFPFIVHLVSAPLHLLSNSYSMTFAAAILVNYVLFLLSVLLSYYLAEKLFSRRIAFWSSVLFIFSPFAHSWLVQTETSVFGIFSAILSLYLLYNYSQSPTRRKLVFFSLIVGVLMLGKMNLAVGIFILLFAFWNKKFKDGLIFFVLQFAPFLFWYLLVTKVWGLNFGMQEVSKFGAGVWVFSTLKWPLYQIVAELVGVLPNFLTAVLYGFLLVPIIFSVIGFYFWQFKQKTIIYGGMCLAYLVFFFALRLYLPRHAFFLFPIIYPTAVLGIDKAGEWLSRYKFYRPWVYYGLVYFLIIFPALLSVFKMYEYLGVAYS